MEIVTALKNELLAILYNRKLLIAIIGVMTIPLLYSGTYLWAFWDPYGHLDRLPVAVVNNDQGAVYNGTNLAIGKDLVEKLKEKKGFHWQFVSKKEAVKGMKNQDYYLKVEIPKDFSKNAATLQSEKPKKLTLVYTANEGYNYLSSKIGDSAIEKIKEEVSSTVTKTYAESMLKKSKDVAAGLTKASYGAGELNNGINSAKTGVNDLEAGFESAKGGTVGLVNGSSQVDSGAKKLKEKLQMLAAKSVAFSEGAVSASAGSKQLQAGLNQFGAGLGQMKSGTADLLAGAQKSEDGATRLSNGLDSAAGNMPELQSGSKQIADGAGQLSSSMDQWSQGAEQTKSGAEELNQGLKQAVDLVSQMAAGTNDAAQKAQLETLKSSLAQLSSGSLGVADGLGQLSNHAAAITQAANQLSVGANQLNLGQNQLAGGINQLASGAKDLAAGQKQLTAGISTIDKKIDLAMKGYSQLTSGHSSLSSGLDQLAAGSVQMEDGTDQLANGSTQLADGTNQLSVGTKKLQVGMSQLAGGSSELSGGINKLSFGSKELEDQLQNGAKATSAIKANNRVYDMFAKPVNVKDDRLNHVPDYGTGFAPYFLSLSLFVGALVLSVIFPMLEPAVRPKSGFGWFTGKLGIIFAVGLGQALLADVILLQVLGLEVKSAPYFIMLSIFTSWTFFAIIQFLVTVLDNPGRFLAIIMLVLQLTSSSGTYPIELTPNFLQAIAHFMPMTYTVAGFRAIISTGDFSYMWMNIGYESIFFITFLAATLVFFLTKFKRQHQPQF
ncbi:YhgE/Pip domain-containing protein [Bacillus sp. EB600]|uniref:YhgE/Pip domain-containing protein n=1 Tax=Bacillus sp. EB600 TaxID=2806345 RepID=UPI00210D9123|nr:YhgE/Pip domain-containing protein [Bacillus sp. EB600]MCQ6282260.1 YhgE/Pip domain-containing protein [Bacillus sp. EB600]